MRHLIAGAAVPARLAPAVPISPSALVQARRWAPCR